MTSGVISCLTKYSKIGFYVLFKITDVINSKVISL